MTLEESIKVAKRVAERYEKLYWRECEEAVALRTLIKFAEEKK